MKIISTVFFLSVKDNKILFRYSCICNKNKIKKVQEKEKPEIWECDCLYVGGRRM